MDHYLDRYIDSISSRSGVAVAGTANDKLDTEEGQKKAQTLFSRKFIEYLSNKKLNPRPEPYRTRSRRSHDPNASLLPRSETTTPTAGPSTAGAGTPTSEDTADYTSDESSRKSYRKVRKKTRSRSGSDALDFDYVCRSKQVQCNLLVQDADRMAVTDDLQPFLMNMTVLLPELKQNSDDPTNLHGLISKTTVLITEFGRRPVKEVRPEDKTDHVRNFEKSMTAIMDLVNEYRKNSLLDADNGLREHMRIEREIAVKDEQLAEARQKLAESEVKIDQQATDVDVRVKNAVLYNERLKALIRFNHSQAKKLKKLLVEREWTKHKLANEVAHLRKKVSKLDLTDLESFADKSATSPEPSLASDSHHKNLTGRKPKSPGPKKKSAKSPR